MLYVSFVEGQHDKIKKHERIPFHEAVEFSQDIEMEMRERNKTIASYFYVIDDELSESLYEGELTFGSYAAPNLFIHIKNNLPQIKTNKENEKLRLSFIADMEELVDDKFKMQEDTETDIYKNLDRSKISHLKRWQRRSIYGVAGFFALTTVGVFAFFFVQLVAVNQEHQTIASETEERDQVIGYYEQALLGESEELEVYFAKRDMDDLSTSETTIYAGFAADNKDFQTLNALFDTDTILVATFLSQEKDTETLREYDDYYPTNEARFDLAFAAKEYEALLEIENVEMNTTRSEMRTEAFLQLGDLDGAREELENNNSSELEERISLYEALNGEIADLTEQIENIDEDEDEEERESLEEQRQELENEINDI